MVKTYIKIRTVGVLATAYTLSFALHAEIITDGSVGAAQTLSGPDFTIPQSLGHTAGTNLFHSFQNFNLAQPESATFTGSDTIQNVISRVTGGQASSIDGALNSQVGQANFYFINPSGVVFGPNAQVNVPGDFHVSTANGLRFEDGSVFSALPNNASTLTLATPTEFGFLNDQSAAIRIEGSRLTFVPGSKVSLSAGSLQMSGGELIKDNEGEVVTDDRSALINPAGEVSLQAAGNLQMENALLEVDGNRMGRISISASETTIKGSELSAKNSGSGSILPESGIDIQVASLQVENTDIFAFTGDSNDAGTISLTATHDMDFNNSRVWGVAASENKSGAVSIKSDGSVVIRKGTSVLSFSDGEGKGNSVQIQAHTLTIDGQGTQGTMIWTAGNGQGQNGDIQINVETLLTLDHGGSISANASGAQEGGNIQVQAGDITIQGSVTVPDGKGGTVPVSSSIGSSTFGSGAGGHVTISADRSLNLINGGSIDSLTLSQGNAGQVTVQANALLIDGQNSQNLTGIRTLAIASDKDTLPGQETGNAGNVNINIEGSLDILNGGNIVSDTTNTGHAGQINVQAGDISIRGGLDGPSRISSSTRGKGDGGEVTVLARGALNLVQGGTISSITTAQGNGGVVKVQAENIFIDGEASRFITGITSDARTIPALGTVASGHAGSVEVVVDDSLEIVRGGWISNDTSGDGSAGDIQIQTGSLLIDGQNAGEIEGLDGNKFTGISSDAQQGSGNAGKITIIATGSLQLLNGSSIRSDTKSRGNAGKIQIQASDILIDGTDRPILDIFTGISSDAETNSSGNAGEIHVETSGALAIFNGGAISSRTKAEGNGGKIVIHANRAIMDGEKNPFGLTRINTSTEGSGAAGTIEITTDRSLHIANDAQIVSATFSEGAAGRIDIKADTLMIHDFSDVEGIPQ